MKTKYLFIIQIFIIACSQPGKVNMKDKELLQNIENPDSILKKILKANPDYAAVTIPKNGQQFREERYLAAGYHPAKIDLSGNNNPIKSLTLSEISSDIQYIRLKLPPEGGSSSTSFRGSIGTSNLRSTTWPFEIVPTENYIILSNVFGIYLYSKSGELLDTLYKNKVAVESFSNMIMWKPAVMSGSKPIIDEVNNKIYLTEFNFEKQQNKLLEYDAEFLAGKVFNKSEGEKNQPTVKLNKTINLALESHEFDLISPGALAEHKSTMKRGIKKQEQFLTILTTEGDTVTSFNNNLNFQPFLSSVTRSPERRISYYNHNTYTFKQEYNDTIFRFIYPNKLLPAYVFNFGNKKLNASEAYNPKINIDDKLHLDNFFETQNFLLMKLVIGFDCPNNRKAGKVSFVGAWYDKKTAKVNFLPAGIVKNPDALDIPNDIDGGLPFWPTATTRNGELIQWVSSEKLKETLTENWFAKSKAPEKRKKALQVFVNQLGTNEAILIVVKQKP